MIRVNFCRRWSTLALLVLTGCASSQSDHYYSLVNEVPASATPGTYVVAIAPAQIPEFADRLQIVTVDDKGEWMMPDNRRWTESLREAIPHAVGARFSRTLPEAIVAQSGDHSAIGARYRLLLDVKRMTAQLGRQVALELNWTLVPADGERTVHRFAASLTPAGAEYGDLVRAYSRLIEQAADEIACHIGAAEHHQPVADCRSNRAGGA